MSRVTLHYFNLAGRGDMIRLAFHIAGEPFIDDRIELKDWPGEYRARAPAGVLPYLEFPDGTCITESMACFMYAATLAGLIPVEPAHQAFAEQAIGLVKSSLDQMSELFQPNCDRLKVVDNIKATLSAADQIIGRTMSSSGYAVGSSLTHADVVIYTYLFKATPAYLPELAMPVIQQIAPNLYKLGQTVSNDPKVTAFYS